MGIMDTVAGGVGTGIQPKDNPNPAAASPTAGAQTLLNSIPKTAPAPSAPSPFQANPSPGTPPTAAPSPTQSQGQPSSDNAKEEADAIAKLKKNLSSPEDKEQSDIVAKLNQHFSGQPDVDTSQPQTLFDTPAGKHWFNYLRAEMRSKLGTTPEQQLEAFQSMYGDENAKIQNSQLYFRDGADQKFLKADQSLTEGKLGKKVGAAVDWALYNMLNAVPMAANVAGMSGTMALGPETGGAALAASGAVGGLAESGTRQFMQFLMNQMSNKPQTGDTERDMVKTTALNTAMAPIGGLVAGGLSAGARGAANFVRGLGESGDEGLSGIAKAGQALKDALAGSVGDQTAEQVEQRAGEQTTMEAMRKTAVTQWVKQLFPYASLFEDPTKFASSLKDVFTNAESRIGQAVGAIKSEVLSTAGDQKIQMSATRGAIKKILTENGFYENAQNRMVPPSEDDPLVHDDIKKTFNVLHKYYNILSGKAEIGGLSPQEMFNSIDSLAKRSEFNKISASAEQKQSAGIFQKVWQGAADDRNEFINGVMKDSPSENGKLWEQEFRRYHDQIGGIKDFKDILSDDASRENFVNSLMGGGKVDRANMLNSAKAILGEHSPESWNALRGQMMNFLNRKFSTSGAIDAPGFISFIENPANESVKNALFDNPKDLNAFKQMLLDGTDGSSDASKGILKRGAKVIINMMHSPGQALEALMHSTGNDATKIRYLQDQGFQDLVDQAEGPEMRRRIQQLRSMTDGLMSEMKVVDVPNAAKRGTAKTIKRLVPVTDAAASQFLNNKVPVASPPVAPDSAAQ